MPVITVAYAVKGARAPLRYCALDCRSSIPRASGGEKSEDRIRRLRKILSQNDRPSDAGPDRLATQRFANDQNVTLWKTLGLKAAQ
jgi:hypothetical protein